MADIKTWCGPGECRRNLVVLYEGEVAALRAQLAEAQATRDEFKRDAIALEELRVVVAEIEGQDTKTWPSHGNKALAIAALYKLNHDAIYKQRAQLAARDEEVKRLRVLAEEAIESIEDWAGYADAYFQNKHDLKGELARLRAALNTKE